MTSLSRPLPCSKVSSMTRSKPYCLTAMNLELLRCLRRTMANWDGFDGIGRSRFEVYTLLPLTMTKSVDGFPFGFSLKTTCS